MVLNRSMNITQDLHYAGPLADVLPILRSEELAFRRIQELGTPEYTFTHNEVNGKPTTEVTVTVDAGELPDRAAMFVGKYVTATVKSVETVTSAGAQIDYALSAKLPVKVAARMLLVDAGAVTAGRLEVHLNVSIPFAGAMIERKIAEEIPKVLAKDVKLVNELIVEKRGQAHD